MSLFAFEPRSISRPFVSLTQDARIAEKGKNRVKDKDYLLPKQSHSTAEDAEIAEKTNNRVKHKSIIRRSFVASESVSDVKDVSTVIPAKAGIQRSPQDRGGRQE